MRRENVFIISIFKEKKDECHQNANQIVVSILRIIQPSILLILGNAIISPFPNLLMEEIEELQ